MSGQTMLTISYALSLPHGTNPPSSLAPNSEHAFSIVNGKVASNNPEYYEALRKAIATAKDKVGEELTAWRDAVGTRERRVRKREGS